MPHPMKYAVVESERRFLLGSLPDRVERTDEISDRYVTGTRIRLREVVGADGQVVRKLGHKVRLTPGPERVACTSVYLDDAEWAVLMTLPGRVLHKRRHHVLVDGVHVAVDELPDGTLLAEIDGGDQPVTDVPPSLDVLREVTTDEAWTGAELASDS
jgi:CYTH domain-containing protein